MRQAGATSVISKKRFTFSLDTWAVLVALLAAILVRIGLIPRVPW